MLAVDNLSQQSAARIRYTAKLGNVEGIYSDLLLHDMGQEMGDEGSYPDTSSEDDDEPLVPRIVPNLLYANQPGQVALDEAAPTSVPPARSGKRRRGGASWRLGSLSPRATGRKRDGGGGRDACVGQGQDKARSVSSSLRRGSSSRSRRSSNRWSPRPPSGWLATATERTGFPGSRQSGTASELPRRGTRDPRNGRPGVMRSKTNRQDGMGVGPQRRCCDRHGRC